MKSDQELSRLFRAERAEQPSIRAAEQGWQRLAQDLATAAAPMPVAMGPLKLGAWLFPHWILAGFALGVTGAAVIAPALTPTVPRRAESTVRAATHAPSAPPPSSAPAVVEPLVSALSAGARKAAPSSIPRPTATNSAPASFDAELKLISAAKQELDAQHPAQALVWLEDHAQRFPQGVFSSEREALRVLAHCMQGDRNQVSVQAFATLHPGSPLITRLQRACGSSADATKRSASAESHFPEMAK